MFGNNNEPAAAKAPDSATGKKSPKNGASPRPSSPPAPPSLDTNAATTEKEKDRKRKSSKASELIASARNTFSSLKSSSGSSSSGDERSFRVIIKEDPDVQTPSGNSNSAGESKPGPRSTFRVGVTEDKNKKCRRAMEDTHSYLYNFLQHSPSDQASTSSGSSVSAADDQQDSDNGYFAIFDGHAGTYAAEWCGRKLHVVLEETIRKHPNSPIPELLDMTFTNCDGQLEKLPSKNSGCTAVCAVLRWEDRPVKGDGRNSVVSNSNNSNENSKPKSPTEPRTERQRVLYTANVGDARIVLCRNGKALRLSYDHKGSDENEGKRVANAGGLILNNRVNGVLAVTRALGDSYMKELVTGHPYTTESVLQEQDEFIILACDGLWDVCQDQEAVDLIRNVHDPQEASRILVEFALGRFSTDNLSCMIVRLDPTGKFEAMEKEILEREQRKKEAEEAAASTGNQESEDSTPTPTPPANNADSSASTGG